MKIPALLLLLTIFVGAPMLDAKEVKDPIFVRWLSATRAKDQTILTYWEKAKKDELSSKGLIDLGTMLFRRGFPNDAIDMFELALDKEKENPEAWYRIGLVEHKKGDLGKARRAYEKCLKQMSGHGWCNFYLGYLEETTGKTKKALEHYATAFRHAPELADPKINPEVLYSKLYVAALVKHTEETRFARAMPMEYLEPGRVHGTTKRMQRTIEEKRNQAQPQDDVNSAKTEPAQPSAENSNMKPAAPPQEDSTVPAAQNDNQIPPESTQEAKPPAEFEVHTATTSSKRPPQRRRPRTPRATPIPDPNPDAEPIQPADKKPPVDPNEG